MTTGLVISTIAQLPANWLEQGHGIGVGRQPFAAAIAERAPKMSAKGCRPTPAAVALRVGVSSSGVGLVTTEFLIPEIIFSTVGITPYWKCSQQGNDKNFANFLEKRTAHPLASGWRGGRFHRDGPCFLRTCNGGRGRLA